MTQERIQKKAPQKTIPQSEVEVSEVKADEEAERLKAEADELLDEIDALLEVNAEEFVRSYVQKSGQ